MDEEKKRGLAERPQILIAIGIIAGFVALFIFVLSQIDAEENRWTRLMFLFGSAEAIVFSAVGWIFGSEVHRERAETAEATARDATEERDSAVVGMTREQERGRALAESIRSGEVEDDLDDDEGLIAGEDSPPRRRSALVRLADELFPRESKEGSTQ